MAIVSYHFQQKRHFSGHIVEPYEPLPVGGKIIATDDLSSIFLRPTTQLNT